MQDAFIFLCEDGSLRQGHAQRQTLREASRDPLPSARNQSLQEEDGVADVSESGRDAENVMEDLTR